MLYADRNLKSLETTVNAQLSNVYDWLTANKLSLNIKKSNFVIFRPRQKKLNYEVKYSTIKLAHMFPWRKNYVKYLGALMGENLSWKYYIVHFPSKISRTIGIIARLRHFVPLATLLYSYITLIQPYLFYLILAQWEFILL